jgi:small conductance mechanosensitive channel
VFTTVSEIQIFVTRLVALNNQTVFIPNGILSKGKITNYALEKCRGADLTLAISYNSDIKKAKDLILSILNENPQYLKHLNQRFLLKTLQIAQLS